MATLWWSLYPSLHPTVPWIARAMAADMVLVLALAVVMTVIVFGDTTTTDKALVRSIRMLRLRREKGMG